MAFGYCQPKVLQIFDEKAPSLDDFLPSIKETHRFSLTPINCNEESLQEFISILFPDTFTVQDTITNEDTITNQDTIQHSVTK